MVFKVARKPPKDAPDNAWKYGKVDIPIPAAAMDITVRKVPKDFKLDIPDVLPERRDSTASSTAPSQGPMEEEENVI
jgi:hypothetical protein